MRIRPDQLDREALKDLMRHRGYALLSERIERAEQQLLQGLTGSKSWEETLRLQGALGQLRSVRGMPGEIDKEIGARLKQQETTV